MDECRKTSSKEVIKKIKKYPCSCKSEGEHQKKEAASIKDRIFEIYGEMASEFMGKDYWLKNREAFKQELEKDYMEYNPELE